MLARAEMLTDLSIRAVPIPGNRTPFQHIIRLVSPDYWNQSEKRGFCNTCGNPSFDLKLSIEEWSHSFMTFSKPE